MVDVTEMGRKGRSHRRKWQALRTFTLTREGLWLPRGRQLNDHLTGHLGQRENGSMRDKEISATEFKAKCLTILDEVATGMSVVVTKRGKPAADGRHGGDGGGGGRHRSFRQQ
jgi:hypothetical protein